MRFWLSRGVAGLRVDVIDRLLKDPAFRDNPPNPDYDERTSNPQDRYLRVHSEKHPDVHNLIRELRRTTNEFGDRPLIGEIDYSTDAAFITSYYGAQLEGMQLPFNFALLLLPWEAARLRNFVDRYDALVPPGGQPNYVLGNHDSPRLAARLGAAQARVAAVLLLTLRGTPTLYYGDELGMEAVYIAPDDYRDPQGINLGISRDPQRTPMQWDITPNAGFTSGNPWLPVGQDYLTRNVETQSSQPDSMLALYRRLIALRRASAALTLGSYRSVSAAPDDCYVYLREHGSQRFCIALNMGDRMRSLALPQPGAGRVVVSTHMDRSEAVNLGALHLRENEGVVIALD
jgi:alpha-glucosidase